MKKYIKILIDILMTILLIILMGYHITNNLIHEISPILFYLKYIVIMITISILTNFLSNLKKEKKYK